MESPTPESTLTNLRPLLVQAASDWDVASVKSTLAEHEIGDFAGSALLLDAFGRDDRISACLGRRASALAARKGLPFCVEPPEDASPPGKADKIAKVVAQNWWDAHDEATLRRVMRDAIGLGVCVGFLTWRAVAGTWLPKLNVLHCANVRWDFWRATWLLRTLDGEIPITPGDGTWFLFSLGGSLDPFLEGAVRALGMSFVFRGFTWRDWVRWSERHGMPILKASVPAGAKSAKAWLAKLGSIGSEAAVEIPKASGDGAQFDLELLEATSTGYEGFQRLLERIDLCTAVCLLGQNLTTEVQAGAYASSQVHKSIEGTILSGDAEALSTALRDQVWKWFAIYNYGDPELAPWGVWDTSPPEDRGAAATAISVFADGLTKLVALNVPVDIAELCEQFAIPLREGARVPEPEAPDPEAEPDPNALLPGQTDPNADPAEGNPAMQNDKPQMHALALAQVRGRTGMVNGQAYIDAVAAKAAQAARLALAPDVAAVLAAINGATTLDEVKARILVAFEGMAPDRLAAITEKAIVLSRMSGRAAVMEDL